MVYSAVDVGGAERDVVRERSRTARHIETRGAHSHTDRLKPGENMGGMIVYRTRMVEVDSDSPWTAELETREIGIGGVPRRPSVVRPGRHLCLPPTSTCRSECIRKSCCTLRPQCSFVRNTFVCRSKLIRSYESLVLVQFGATIMSGNATVRSCPRDHSIASVS